MTERMMAALNRFAGRSGGRPYALWMDHESARRFAGHWLEAWNSHDLDAVLSHCSDDVVFSSPGHKRSDTREDADASVE